VRLAPSQAERAAHTSCQRAGGCHHSHRRAHEACYGCRRAGTSWTL